MALVEDIRNALSSIGAAFADGIIYCRFLQSNPNLVTRTYSPWQRLPLSRAVESDDKQVFDDNRSEWMREETFKLRVPFGEGVILKIGDQVRIHAPGDPEPLVWSVRSNLVCAAGSVTEYLIARTTPMTMNPRKGGV